MINDCRINNTRYKSKICNLYTGRYINRDGITLKNILNNERNSKNININKLLKYVSKNINIVPKKQKKYLKNETRETLNIEILRSIITSWLINKNEFLHDPEDLPEYIDDIFTQEFSDYGIKTEDEMDNVEYNDWIENCEQLKQIILNDASNTLEIIKYMKSKSKKNTNKKINKSSCNSRKQQICKKPDCIWVNKKRTYCRKSKNN